MNWANHLLPECRCGVVSAARGRARQMQGMELTRGAATPILFHPPGLTSLVSSASGRLLPEAWQQPLYLSWPWWSPFLATKNPPAKTERGQPLCVVIWATAYSMLNPEGRGMACASEASWLQVCRTASPSSSFLKLPHGLSEHLMR